MTKSTDRTGLILHFFNSANQKVYKRSELKEIFTINKKHWRIPVSVTFFS